MPEQVSEWIHIEHAGPVESQMLLIILHTKTKWLEFAQVSSTSASVTIIIVSHSLFFHFGIFKSMIRNNGPGFKSEEFVIFLCCNGIAEVKTPPYHLIHIQMA